jgi:hypothetical protein
MNPEVLRELSAEFLLLSVVHHVALVVVVAILWMRREAMARTVDVYFAIAFATAGVALATRPETRLAAAAAGVLAALWAWDAARPRLALTLGRTPRLRLWIMVALGLFGFGYPGYSGELPSAFFAPLGVILPPTVIVALAVVNAAWPSTNRVVHWALAATGLVVGGVGLVIEGWIHVPIIGISIYAIALLLGAGRVVEERPTVRDRSVREIRDRMYSRRTILPGPRDPRRRRLNVRKRRRR